MHRVFSVSEKSGLQACKLSTWSLLQWSHAVVVRAESGLASCSWNKHNLRWKICQNTITDVCFWTIQYNNHSLSSLPCIVLCPWLKKKYKNSNFNWSNHRTVFYFASFHHKWAWTQRRRQHFWILFIYIFFSLLGTILTCICGYCHKLYLLAKLFRSLLCLFLMQSSFSRGPVDHVHSQLGFGQAIFCN